MKKGLFEGFTHKAVDEKIWRWVDDEKPVVETGQTEVPHWGAESFWTAKHLFHHEELNTVEDDTRSVAEEKDDNNADENGGKIHLIVLVLIGLHVSVPES